MYMVRTEDAEEIREKMRPMLSPYAPEQQAVWLRGIIRIWRRLGERALVKMAEGLLREVESTPQQPG